MTSTGTNVEVGDASPATEVISAMTVWAIAVNVALGSTFSGVESSGWSVGICSLGVPIVQANPTNRARKEEIVFCETWCSLNIFANTR
ncbi:MAG: hypothetical protein HC806_05255 [Anaerolineae bacterium]|nr:hypothetical protein [Anaerolineae bacterium]